MLVVVRTYRELFRIGEFRVLFATQCLTMAAGSIAGLALGTTVFDATGSPVLAGLSMFGGPLVAVLGSSFLLATSDLVRPRRALVLVAVVTVLADLLQAIPGLSWPARFGLLAAVWLVLSATGGSTIALVSEMVPPDGFVLARSTMNIAVGVMQAIGYAAGGLLLLVLTTTELFLTAAAFGAVAAVLLRLGLRDHPARARGPVVSRTRSVNRALLASRVTLPLFLCLWVPNGLIVGCEALFIPLARDHAGYLLSAAGAGMLVGDVVVGRFVPPARRDALIEPLRLLLALPYLLFFLVPGTLVAGLLAFVASLGYAASLPLQERLLDHTAADARGQVLGLKGTGMMVMQAVGALLAGLLAQALGGPRGTAHAIGIMAVASILVTLALTPGLRRSVSGDSRAPSAQ